MSLEAFEKGESIPRTVTLTDDSDSVLDTINFLTITVRVYSRIHNVIGTYTLADGDVTKVSPTHTLPASNSRNRNGIGELLESTRFAF